eukprot:4359802-Prymnesium_polylepis.1
MCAARRRSGGVRVDAAERPLCGHARIRWWGRVPWTMDHGRSLAGVGVWRAHRCKLVVDRRG